MSRFSNSVTRWASSNAACAAVLFCGLAAAQAQSLQSSERVQGRIDFDSAKLPAATVEVDLSQEMFRDLFGLGDAAVAGVAESLLASTNGEAGTQGTRLAAEQLAAARQIMQLAGDVVHEVRVRVYEDLPEDSGVPSELMADYESQLADGNWETVMRVRDGDENVNLALVRNDGAVRGAFVVIADGRDLVLSNIVCDASPDAVKKLASAATQIGLENGLREALEQKMREMHRRLPRPDSDADESDSSSR